jgi:hypothetical protein
MNERINSEIIKHLGKPVVIPGGGFSAIFERIVAEGKFDKKGKDYPVPVLFALDSDLVDLKKGDPVTVTELNKTFTIIKIIPDDGGMSIVYLTDSGNGAAWYDEE